MLNKWTNEQENAIVNRGGTLLISAAAGSGKTAVLVERVIKRIIDENIDINKFLIVTFTEAAATEMREKITKAITLELSKNPKNTNLSRQLNLIYQAKIATVHSFCMGIIRENAHFLDLRADFRIGDTNECEAMLEDALSEVLDEFYETNSEGSDFYIFANNAVSGRDDRKIETLIMETYNKVQSSAFPIKSLDRMLDEYLNFASVDSSKWAQSLRKQAIFMLKYCEKMLNNSLKDMSDNYPELFEKYSTAFSDDLKTVITILQKLENATWDIVVEAIQSVTHLKLAPIRGFEDKEYLEKIKNYRTKYKKILDNLSSKLFSLYEKEILEDIAIMEPFIRSQIEVTKAVIQKFGEMKRRKNILDFGDLEHFAVELVTEYNEKGDLVPSKIAKEINFTEIMVDEYQDTNEVQDMLFRMISNDEKNIFMVGDVKQSIYRFRLADPSIFLAKYKAYKSLEMAEKGENRKIILSKNFRSRDNVLSFVNYIFQNIMTAEFGAIDYNNDEFLHYGMNYQDEENPFYNTELCLINLENSEDELEKETPKKAQIEARAVANNIAKMISEKKQVFDKNLNIMRDCKASDFAILLRSPKNKQKFYKEALENLNIRGIVSEDENLLKFPEILALTAFLEVIDNPNHDIPLIAVMRSPIFGFTEDELAEIRLFNRDMNFYECVKISAGKGNHKAENFLAELDFFRNQARNVPVHTLMYHIFDRKHVLAIYGAFPNGKIRQNHLMQFFEYARCFENNNYRGLFQFVLHIRRLNERSDEISTTNFDVSSGVKIMSIHKSKGLEFPIVFLCDATKIFNKQDMLAAALVDNDLGIAPKCRDNVRKIEYSSLPRFAIAEKLKKDMLEEELRVLYVALTRAREKLVIVGTFKNLSSTIGKLMQNITEDKFDPYFLQTVDNYADLVLLCALKHPSGQPLRDYVGGYCPVDLHSNSKFDIEILGQNFSEGEKNGIEVLENSNYEDATKIGKKLTFFDYDYRGLQDIPSKLTATELNKREKEITAVFSNDLEVSKTAEKMKIPNFVSRERELTASEKGIAHHLFMQVCDFYTIKTHEDVLRQKTILLEKGIISIKQFEAIDSKKILGFFKSELFERIQNSTDLRREFRFSILVPCQKYFNEALDENEKILLQGVIDCMFLENNKWVIIDFKTDFVTDSTCRNKANSYRKQLEVYKDAVREIFGAEVSDVYIYFFSNAKEIKL